MSSKPGTSTARTDASAKKAPSAKKADATPLIPTDAFPVRRRVVSIKGTEPPDAFGPGDLGILERRTIGRRTIMKLAEALSHRGAAGLVVNQGVLRDLSTQERRALEEWVPILQMGANWREAASRLLQGPVEATSDPDAVLRAILQGRFVAGPLPAHLEAGSSVRAMAILTHPQERTRVPLSKLEEVVAAEALLRDPRAHAVTLDGLVVALAGEYDLDGQEDGLAEALMHRAQAALLIGKMTVGVGRTYGGLEGIRRTYREAAWAARCAERLGQGNRVVAFRDLGIYGMLEPFVADPSTADTEDVEKLIEYDRQNHTALLPTLEAYFQAGASGDAAASLFVHRNTVSYRLRAVKRVTGLDVREADARLLLEVQLRLARIRGLLAAGGLPRRSRRGRRS